ncbi:NADPH-dependent FMN reductase [Lutibacter sp.]|uniref:NADPH-dependent FMN reductase n=1 Tax=Lutibacter sp. TaxID=1925666 RepID=UPI003564F6D2
MKNIITLGGSSSRNSINKQLAEYVGELVNNVTLIKIDLNEFEMPLFSVDIEAKQGFSEGTKKLNELFEKADGFIISLAEHNGAYSAAFKNTFDWLSRVEAKVFRNKPLILLSTSPGVRGGQSVLEIALNRFPYHNANIVGSLAFPSFNENFNNGQVTNMELKQKLLSVVQKFENTI